MPFINELCQAMANNPNVLTFSEIATALAQGAAVGQKSNMPGGAVIGASASLSLAAGKKVIALSKSLLEDLEQSPKPNKLLR